MIAVGGSREVSFARPGNYEIYLNNRKGFIKVAIETGSSIVPVISFGEVDIFNQVSNKTMRIFQNAFLNLTGVYLPILNGRGFFQYSFGLIPRRRAITTVVGAPIDVSKIESPIDKDIDELHKKFLDGLTELFDQNKGKYCEDPQATLIIR